jgi:hypothetical protein
MLIDFKDAATGDPKAFELMISWCERNQSKVILGGTLTSGADGAASTNALGNVHNEVRKDLRDGDIRQLNATITRDLVYAIAAMNGLAPDGIKRCPRFGLITARPKTSRCWPKRCQAGGHRRAGSAGLGQSEAGHPHAPAWPGGAGHDARGPAAPTGTAALTAVLPVPPAQPRP